MSEEDSKIPYTMGKGEWFSVIIFFCSLALFFNFGAYSAEICVIAFCGFIISTILYFMFRKSRLSKIPED